MSIEEKKLEFMNNLDYLRYVINLIDYVIIMHRNIIKGNDQFIPVASFFPTLEEGSAALELLIDHESLVFGSVNTREKLEYWNRHYNNFKAVAAYPCSNFRQN